MKVVIPTGEVKKKRDDETPNGASWLTLWTKYWRNREPSQDRPIAMCHRCELHQYVVRVEEMRQGKVQRLQCWHFIPLYPNQAEGPASNTVE